MTFLNSVRKHNMRIIILHVAFNVKLVSGNVPKNFKFIDTD